MTFKVVPINMVVAPNMWQPLTDAFWTIQSNQIQTIWGQLKIVDTLGEREYVPATGSTLQAVFQRGDMMGHSPFLFPYGPYGNPLAAPPPVVTVTKTATLNTDNRSLAMIALTADESSRILSGTILWTLVEGTVTTTWTQNWSAKAVCVNPGW